MDAADLAWITVPSVVVSAPVGAAVAALRAWRWMPLAVVAPSAGLLVFFFGGVAAGNCESACSGWEALVAAAGAGAILVCYLAAAIGAARPRWLGIVLAVVAAGGTAALIAMLLAWGS